MNDITLTLNLSFDETLMGEKIILVSIGKGLSIKDIKINSFIKVKYSFTKIQLADEMQRLN